MQKTEFIKICLSHRWLGCNFRCLSHKKTRRVLQERPKWWLHEKMGKSPPNLYHYTTFWSQQWRHLL